MERRLTLLISVVDRGSNFFASLYFFRFFFVSQKSRSVAKISTVWFLGLLRRLISIIHSF